MTNSIPIFDPLLYSDRIFHETSANFGDKARVVQPVHIVQYDKSMPIVCVKLYNNGLPYVLPDSVNAITVRWGKSDRTFVIKNVLGCNPDRTVVYFDVDEQMTVLYGEANPILEIKLDDGVISGSTSIPFRIDRNPVQHGDIRSCVIYPDLEQAVKDAEDAAERAEKATGIQLQILGSVANPTQLPSASTLKQYDAYLVGDEGDYDIYGVVNGEWRNFGKYSRPGPQGPQGPMGPAGPQGPKGDPGDIPGRYVEDVNYNERTHMLTKSINNNDVDVVKIEDPSIVLPFVQATPPSADKKHSVWIDISEDNDVTPMIRSTASATANKLSFGVSNEQGRLSFGDGAIFDEDATPEQTEGLVFGDND